jgi:hypothetical protein
LLFSFIGEEIGGYLHNVKLIFGFGSTVLGVQNLFIHDFQRQKQWMPKNELLGYRSSGFDVSGFFFLDARGVSDLA